ncbi:hypothetical protein [Methyloceanibacter sp.]|uniref:hypothetical protein n=1 Tax=Methyloceanibacter sp. TaxID=1965321 RepID=UPI002D5E34ED|nr:hypothetical protein [Methyloceanibacter sp.]HZP09901.1 hypothetical protein [Methyloceanibacter sp.]
MLYLSHNVTCESRRLSARGVFSALFKIAMSAVAWFLTVAWLNLEGAHIDAKLAGASAIFVASLTLLLVSLSPAPKELRL